MSLGLEKWLDLGIIHESYVRLIKSVFVFCVFLHNLNFNNAHILYHSSKDKWFKNFETDTAKSSWWRYWNTCLHFFFHLLQRQREKERDLPHTASLLKCRHRQDWARPLSLHGCVQQGPRHSGRHLPRTRWWKLARKQSSQDHSWHYDLGSGCSTQQLNLHDGYSQNVIFLLKKKILNKEFFKRKKVNLRLL